MNTANRDFSVEQVICLRDHVQLFQAAFDEIQLLNGSSAIQSNGDFIFILMLKSNVIVDLCCFILRELFTFLRLRFAFQIGYYEATAMLTLIDKIIDFLADIHRLWQCAAGLRKFKEILWVPFSDEGDAFVKDVKDHYRFYSAFKKDDKGDVIVPHIRLYHFWCFSAKFV